MSKKADTMEEMLAAAAKADEHRAMYPEMHLLRDIARGCVHTVLSETYGAGHMAALMIQMGDLAENVVEYVIGGDEEGAEVGNSGVDKREALAMTEAVLKALHTSGKDERGPIAGAVLVALAKSMELVAASVLRQIQVDTANQLVTSIFGKGALGAILDANTKRTEAGDAGITTGSGPAGDSSIGDIEPPLKGGFYVGKAGSA